MNQSPSERAYYPALDVLRGIAILLVFFYHNFHFIKVFEFGWVGVDLFFVLSGFLITDLLLNSQNKKNYFRNFYIRRFLRIFPLYYLTLIIFFSFAPYFFSQQNIGEYHYYSQNQIWFWSFLQNWFFVDKGLSSSPFLSHFWSLAVEEQFYLFWPLVLFLVKDLRKARILTISLILIVLVMRVYIWIQYPGDMVKYYCNTLTRIDSVLMGCLLSIYIKSGREFSGRTVKIVLGFCLLYFAMSFGVMKNVKNTNPFFSTIGYTVVSVFFATVIYVFIKGNRQGLQWLQQSYALKYIGKISYGIYVFHIPVYLILSSAFMDVFRQDLGLSYLNALLLIAIISLFLTILASAVSFHFLEKPILSLKKHFP